jgi:hypothetical protein
VKATSSSVWARPVKPASYWDGAKYTPLSSIPLLRQTTENFRFRGQECKHTPKLSPIMSPLVLSYLSWVTAGKALLHKSAFHIHIEKIRRLSNFEPNLKLHQLGRGLLGKCVGRTI